MGPGRFEFRETLSSEIREKVFTPKTIFSPFRLISLLTSGFYAS
jgi:hypothetical protein